MSLKPNKLTYKQLTAAATLVGLTIAIPVSVWVARQDTELRSSAYFEKPVPPPAGGLNKNHGQPSEDQPRINLIWPFLGKIGDSVLIEGYNFGDNPQNKVLKFGNTIVPEDQILRWTPTLIEFLIPSHPSGLVPETISLIVAGQIASWDYPFTVYDLTTLAQVAENQNLITVSGCPADSLVEIYFDNGEKLTSRVDTPLNIPETAVLSVRLLDASGQALPFFVDPTEFGF